MPLLGGKMQELKIIITGNPITKKNSQQIFRNKKTGKTFIAPSKQYKEYEKQCFEGIKDFQNLNIDTKINVKCVYYMKTKRKVDITNLMNATHDILVKYNVIADDNNSIVQSVDGSRVKCDKDNPRVEITIEEVECEK